MSNNMSIMDLNTWVSKVFPISGADWKQRVNLTRFFRIKLDDLQNEVKTESRIARIINCN